MRPVSAELLEVIRGPHRMVARARVVTAYETGTDPEVPEENYLAILDGEVRLDASAAVRATLDLTVDGTGWTAHQGDLLTPYGNEIFVERGVDLGSGIREWVSLGYFRIYQVDQDRAPDGPLRVEGRDRMAGIVDGKLEAPRQFTSATTVGAVVDSLVKQIYPSAVIEYDDGTLTSGQAIGRTIVVEDDRHKALTDLTRSYGKIVRFDHSGTLQILTPPNPSVPVFEVNHGRSGVLVELGRSITRDGLFNAFIAEGEGGDDKPPVRAVARDMSPSSPTYYKGTFGKVPYRFSTPWITTGAQAATAAANALASSIGLPYSVDFTMVPCPALEDLDPVRVTYSDAAGAELHVLDTLGIGLTANRPMPATTRNLTETKIETGDA